MNWNASDLVLISHDPTEAILLGEVIEIVKQAMYFILIFAIGDEIDKKNWKVGHRYSMAISQAEPPNLLDDRKRKILIKGMFERS
jgi:hypothetical protein